MKAESAKDMEVTAPVYSNRHGGGEGGMAAEGKGRQKGPESEASEADPLYECGIKDDSPTPTSPYIWVNT